MTPAEVVIKEGHLKKLVAVVGSPDLPINGKDAATVFKNRNPSWSGRQPVELLRTSSTIGMEPGAGFLQRMTQVIADSGAWVENCLVSVHPLAVRATVGNRSRDIQLMFFVFYGQLEEQSVIVHDPDKPLLFAPLEPRVAVDEADAKSKPWLEWRELATRDRQYVERRLRDCDLRPSIHQSWFQSDHIFFGLAYPALHDGPSSPVVLSPKGVFKVDESGGAKSPVQVLLAYQKLEKTVCLQTLRRHAGETDGHESTPILPLIKRPWWRLW